MPPLMNYSKWKSSGRYLIRTIDILNTDLPLNKQRSLCFFRVSQLQDYVEFMGSEVRVVLVPSIRDANHDFIFPQVLFSFSLKTSLLAFTHFSSIF